MAKVLKQTLLGFAVFIFLVVLGASYVVYQTVWGTPLRFNDLLNRQAIIEALNSPQTMT